MLAHFHVEKVSAQVMAWLTTSGLKVIIAIIVLFIGWKIINKGLKTLKVFLTKKNVDPTLMSFFHAFADIALKILLVICVVSYLGVKTTSFAAIIASAGLAVGLALQGSLSNFAGGVIILLLRPFNVGDFIEETTYTGTVEKITIFYTHIISDNNTEIMVPNGKLVNGIVVNHSSKELRRIDLTFVVNSDNDIYKVKDALSEVLKEQTLIRQDKEPFIGISAQGAGTLSFIVQVWAKSEDYWTIYYDLLEKSKLKFDEEKITMP